MNTGQDEPGDAAGPDDDYDGENLKRIARESVADDIKTLQAVGRKVRPPEFMAKMAAAISHATGGDRTHGEESEPPVEQYEEGP